MIEPAQFQSSEIIIVGAGPAGLMAAETILSAGLPVHIYEAMPAPGRKFLIAGKGGLNLTHSEPREAFLSRYGEKRARLEPYLNQFGPEDLRRWAEGMGVETFTGTSGRVFPRGMKAAPLLYTWKTRLAEAGAVFHPRCRWTGWAGDGSLCFETPAGEQRVSARAVLLALGGASWPQLGSTGGWADILTQKGIDLAPFRPANCGFNVRWSEHFQARFDGAPLKNVTLTFTPTGGEPLTRQGEFIVTPRGVEGSLIYALSAPIRDEIEHSGGAVVHLNLVPGWTREKLAERLSHPRGSRSLSSHLEHTIGIKGVKTGLLWEFLPREVMESPQLLADAVLSLPIPLVSPFPLEEAISTAGGVVFEEMDESLMLRKLPGVFCAGEMLDWEAPTGGYLMTASFATGRAAGMGLVNWLRTATE